MNVLYLAQTFDTFPQPNPVNLEALAASLPNLTTVYTADISGNPHVGSREAIVTPAVDSSTGAVAIIQ